MSNKMCTYTGQAEWRKANPKRKPRSVRVQCPECKRRMKSAVTLCHDECCEIHMIPRHKVKHWWKKKKRT